MMQLRKLRELAPALGLLAAGMVLAGASHAGAEPHLEAEKLKSAAPTVAEQAKIQAAWQAQLDAEAAGTRKVEDATARPSVDPKEWQARIESKEIRRTTRKPQPMLTRPGVPADAIPAESILRNVTPLDASSATAAGRIQSVSALSAETTSSGLKAQICHPTGVDADPTASPDPSKIRYETKGRDAVPDPVLLAATDLEGGYASANAHSRGGNGDNDTVHYARGSVNIALVLVDHAGGTWDEEERQALTEKLAPVREYFLDNMVDEGFLHFAWGRTGGYYYYPAEVPYDIGDYPDFESWMVADAAEDLGYFDEDGDGSNIDEFSIAAQNDGGGWDNVVLVFIPADYSFSTVQVGNGTSWMKVSYDMDWNVWAYLLGKHFGACDEGGTPAGCGGVLCDDVCQSEYLYDQVPNGNCMSCAEGEDCLMRAGWVGGSPCEFTHRNWGWIDDDENGFLDPVRAFDPDTGAPYTLYELDNNSFVSSSASIGFAANQSERNWGVVGVRSRGSSGWMMRIFGDNNKNHHIATSILGGGGVRFIVGDFNQSNPGQDYIELENWSAPGDYVLAHENGDEFVYANGIPRNEYWSSHSVVRAYDVPLFEGETIQFQLDIDPANPDLDLGMALFKSEDWGYYAPRDQSLWEADNWTAGLDETYTFTVPETDTYGLIIFSTTEEAGTFSIKVGPTMQNLAEATPFESAFDLRLYSFWPQHPSWAVAAARPGEDTNATLRLSQTPQFYFEREVSDDYPGVEFAVVDYTQFAAPDDYLRISRESGVQPITTEWEHGPEILSGWHMETWEEGHVCKVWDSYLEAGKAYRFQYYGQLGVFNEPRLYLAQPGEYTYTRSELVVQGTGNELSTWFQFTAPESGWYGAVLVAEEPTETNYWLGMGPAVELADGVRVLLPDEVIFPEMQTVENSWAVLGVHPKEGPAGDVTQSSMWMWECEQEYLSCFLGGDQSGDPMTYMVVDGNHLPAHSLYSRIDRTAGTGGQLVFCDVAESQDIQFDDPVEVVKVSGEFAPGEPVQIWDLDIGLDATAVRVEVVPLDNDMDLSVTVHSSRTGDYYQPSGDRIAVSQDRGPGVSEGLVFVAVQPDVFGLVVANVNGRSGAYEIYVYENGAADVDDAADLPEALDLRVLRGNSAAPQLELSLPDAGPVRMNIFDTQGRKVRSLVDGDFQPGIHRIEWDGRTDRGVRASSGVYFAKVQALGEERTAKWVRAR